MHSWKIVNNKRSSVTGRCHTSICLKILQNRVCKEGRCHMVTCTQLFAGSIGGICQSPACAPINAL